MPVGATAPTNVETSPACIDRTARVALTGTMAKSVADQLIAQLIDAGVRRIYGIVGDSLNPIVDSVRRSGGSAKGGIDWIHVRNEEAAAFAASAEAQLTGELAVCAGSCGPGNLHLINGLFDAHRSGAPVLAIASHIPSKEIGTSTSRRRTPTGSSWSAPTTAR